MKQGHFLFTMVLVALITVPYKSVNAQQTDKKEGKKSEIERFFSKGKVSGKIFANFHSGISESVKKESAFEVKRAYFGYKHKVNEHFSGEIKLDIGSPNDASEYALLKRFAFFKNAYVRYENKNLAINFGLINLYAFKEHEKFNGHRYISKAFLDKYKFASSADLGVSVEYKLAKNLKADFSFTNGEGYKGIQSDNTYLGGLGLTYKPFKGFTTRVYVNATVKDEWQKTYSIFAGYAKKKKYSIGAEFNYQANNKFVNNNNLYGYSIYGKWYFIKHFNVFARYDQLKSNVRNGDKNPWNLAKDGSALIAGIEYSPIKNVKIALNYQDWYPFAKDTDNESFIYCNVLFAF